MKAEALRLVAQLQLADLVKDGPKSVAELAEATGTYKPSLYRLLYSLASCGYFEEVEPEVFAQTPLSYVLRTDIPRSLRGYAIIHGEPWQVDPWHNALRSFQTGKPVFPEMFGKDLWHYFAEDDPTSGAHFSQAISSQSKQYDQAIVRGYDFSAVETIVDVAGGQGSLLASILQAYPAAQGVLFDRPSVIEMARASYSTYGLDERLSMVAGDFFEKVPAGADIYILKQIIHDWEDQECMQILSNCRKAMKPGGRILVVDEIITPGRKIPPIPALIDLQLHLLMSGRKRSEAEHRALFEASGMQLVKVWPTKSTYSILETVVL